MNKKLLQIVLPASALLILITLTCCNHRPATYELVLAEQLMEQKPDSALKVLQQIKNPESLSSRDNALYCLFLTLAKDKNYIRHTSDSVIKIATDYFEKHENTEYLMLAYYCQGRVNTDLEDALLAQEYYLKALELGVNSTDYQLLLKINNNLASLYFLRKVDEMAIPLYKKALYYAKQEKQIDSLNTSFILRNIARTYTQASQTDSAISYYQQALIYSQYVNRSSIYNDLANIYFKRNNYKETTKYLDTAFSLAYNNKKLYPIYLTKGKLYAAMNQIDSAQIYLTQSAESPNLYTKSSSLRRLAELANKTNQYKDYVNYTEEYELLRDSLATSDHSDNIRITQSMFNYQHIAKEKNKFEKEASDRMLLIYQIIVFSSLLLVVGFFLYRRDNQKKINLQKNNDLMYRRSQQYIEDNKHEIARLENDLSQEQIQKDEIQKQLFEARKKMLEIENLRLFQRQGAIQILEKDFHNINLYVRIHHEEDIQLTPCEWLELRHLIDATYPDFTLRLSKVYNRISDDELRICYLAKMKIPVKKIASLVHISPSGVSQCRRRLYKKFTGEPESTENFDKFIADF